MDETPHVYDKAGTFTIDLSNTTWYATRVTNTEIDGKQVRVIQSGISTDGKDYEWEYPGTPLDQVVL